MSNDLKHIDSLYKDAVENTKFSAKDLDMSKFSSKVSHFNFYSFNVFSFNIFYVVVLASLIAGTVFYIANNKIDTPPTPIKVEKIKDISVPIKIKKDISTSVVNKNKSIPKKSISANEEETIVEKKTNIPKLKKPVVVKSQNDKSSKNTTIKKPKNVEKSNSNIEEKNTIEPKKTITIYDTVSVKQIVKDTVKVSVVKKKSRKKFRRGRRGKK